MPQKAKQEANVYDKILKENFAAVFVPFISRHLKLDIVKDESLDPKLQTTLERETDILRLITSSEGEQYILHIELQTRNDNQMIYRFKEYDAIIQRKYQLPVRHFLIYIGPQPMRMQETLAEQMVFRGFETLDIKRLGVDQVLSSQIPEEILLAILTDFKGNDPDAVIVKILERLQTFSNPPGTLRRYLKQLQVLSQLRNLDDPIKKAIRNMPVLLDVRDNVFWQDAFREAKKLAMEEVKQEAQQKAQQEAMKIQEGRILKMHQSGISVENIAHFEDLSLDALKQLLLKLGLDTES